MISDTGKTRIALWQGGLPNGAVRIFLWVPYGFAWHKLPLMTNIYLFVFA